MPIENHGQIEICYIFKSKLIEIGDNHMKTAEFKGLS